MKKNLLTICSVAVALTGVIGLASCSSKDEVPANVVYDNNGTAGVKPEFVISLPRTVVSGTRMSNDVTQSEGTVAQFRGMDNIRLISFSETPTASSVKLSDILGLSAIPGDGLQAPGVLNYKVYADQFVPVGTKNFLFYGKAIDANVDQPINSMDEKFNYGTLKVQGLTDATFNTPNDIVFSLEQINTSNDKQQGNAVGLKVVELLNRLASASVTTAAAPNDKWSTTTNGTLANLYKSFKAVTICPVTISPGSMPKASPKATRTEGATCTMTCFLGSCRASSTASVSSFSTIAPVGHTRLHWPQSTQSVRSMGLS